MFERQHKIAHMDRLKKRIDFLRAAKARKSVKRGFVLQARRREDGDAPSHFRTGFTATKKIGNAVVRNRARRRLKEAARLIFPGKAALGHDYVLIARGLTPTIKFDDIVQDLKRALDEVHRDRHNNTKIKRR